MNGAELPCGSVLRVEPARSNYGPSPKESPPQQIVEAAAAADGTREANLEAGPTEQDDDNEDLDEFFGSL